MNSTSNPQELAESTRSSAFEVALGLALAGAVCGLVALSQSASAEPASIAASVGPATAPARSETQSAEGAPKASDSIEVALMLRQRTASNLLLDEGQ